VKEEELYYNTAEGLKVSGQQVQLTIQLTPWGEPV